MTKDTLRKLRHKQPVKLWDKQNKLIHHIQFNKQEKDFVCWQRFVRYTGTSSVKLWNSYLSLKDIDNIINTIKQNNEIKN